MTNFKFISFAVIFSIFAFVLPNTIQAQEPTLYDNELIAEFTADNITAESLGIDEPSVLPGENGYWWQNFKDQTGLFFTFDANKKADKELKLANKKLLEAKRLVEAGDTNQLDQTLERYQQYFAKVSTRIQADPEKFKNTLSALDRDQLQHQQLLRNIQDKLPEDKDEFIDKIKQSSATAWYQANKEKISDRIQNAVDQNNSGSQFQQIRNMATIDELGELLPDEAMSSLEAGVTRARIRLEEKIGTLEASNAPKLEKYLNNINIHEVNKQKLINHLEDSNIPDDVKAQVIEIKDRNLDRLKDHWQNLDDEKREAWLEDLSDGIDVSKIEILEKIKSVTPTKFREQIQAITEDQEANIKMQIQNIDDEEVLKNLEKRLNNQPSLRSQIRDRKSYLQVQPNSVKPTLTAPSNTATQ